jgi:signal peptidase I
MEIKENLKKFWEFLKADTWQSWLVSLVLIGVIIKFIIFPILTLLTGSPLPLVVVESCSMYHESSFDSWWQQNEAYYSNFNISKSEFENYPLKNGLNKGDIMFVWGKSKEYQNGDILIFQPTNGGTPVIHRIIYTSPEIGTKGDHNTAQLNSLNNAQEIDETSIKQSQTIGKANIKIIPLIGWVKLIFFEPLRSPNERGLCK